MTERKHIQVYTRKQYRCPHCLEIIEKSFFESAQMFEAPCPMCGMEVALPSSQTQRVDVEEERREPRHQASLRVDYKNINDFMTEYTRNISRGGMFIRTERPPRLGSMAEIQLHIPGLESPLALKGEVVHSTFDDSGGGAELKAEEENGVGIRFLTADKETREKLVEFIDSILEKGRQEDV